MAKVTPEDFVAALEEWTVLDVVNAVKLMEEKLGITAAAPVAEAVIEVPGGAPVAEGDGPPVAGLVRTTRRILPVSTSVG
jgi:large subunit ribosomal protein L7/L12